MTPPPGWYRDPSAPHVERWWDGTRWTEHMRAPEAPQAPTAQPGFAPTPGGSGRAKVIALVAAAAVLVAAIVIGAVVLNRDDGSPEANTTPAPESSAPAGDPTLPTPTPSESTSEPSADDPSVVVDELNGITFPLLDGWVRPQYVAEDNVVLTTPDTYTCPGDDGLCRHGRVISRTVTANDEKSPEALAKDDISEAADQAYDRDQLDRRPYGGITSKKLVKQGPVAVAGRTGYFVRWQVKTEKGPGGYVQSLAFPSSVGSQAPVMVRFVFDAGQDGPPLTDMDKITKGIRPVDDGDTSGGVGSSVGPTR